MNTNSKYVGICQRLINFILSMLSSLRTPTRGSTEVPTEEGSFINGKSSIRPIDKPNGDTGSEIMVEFRHADGLESWTQVDSAKDGLFIGGEQQKGLYKRERKKDIISPIYDQKNGRIAKGQGIRNSESLNGTYSRENEVRKIVTFKESEGDGERNKKKEANNSGDQGKSKANSLPREDTKPRPPRRLGPLLSVASNINEKAAAYIQRRKKDYSLDPDHKS